MSGDTAKKAPENNSDELRDEQLEGASGGGVQGAAVKFTMFNPDGTPVRAGSQSAGIHVGPVESLERQS